jgi:hypothetical protein
LNTQEINWIPRTAFLTLAAALDFASVWPDPYVTQPRSQIVRNAVELAKYDGIHYIEPASETYWTCQPRNVYGYTHNRSRKKDESTGGSDVFFASSHHHTLHGEQVYITAQQGHMRDVFSLPNKGGLVKEIDVHDMSNMLSVEEIKERYFPPFTSGNEQDGEGREWDEEACKKAQLTLCGARCNDECITACTRNHFDALKRVCYKTQNVGQPLILRGMAKNMPAYEKWKTDELLVHSYPNSILEVEAGNKQETRTHQQKSLYLDEFVSQYKNSSVYAVASLPMVMAKDIHLPEWVEQGGYTNNLQTSIMWWSSGSK